MAVIAGSGHHSDEAIELDVIWAVFHDVHVKSVFGIRMRILLAAIGY